MDLGIGFEAHGPSMWLIVHGPVIRFGPAIGFGAYGTWIGLELNGRLDSHGSHVDIDINLPHRGLAYMGQ